MAFPHLDCSEGLNYSYTLTYKFTDKWGELWSSRHIRLKKGERKAQFGSAWLLRNAIPGLLEAVGVDVNETAFLAALSSGETEANPNRLIPCIADRLAQRFGAKSEIGSLRKNAHRQLHSVGGASNRDAELEKAEYVSGKIGAKHVFVFDDFITRGATLSKIAGAILRENPSCSVYGLALAKTERKQYSPYATNNHVPKEWDDFWQEGEQKATGVKKG